MGCNIDLPTIYIKLLINIEKCYDDRHLLVHKLGQTDKTYRLKYSTSELNTEIDEKYLKTCLSGFKNFAFKLDNEIEVKLKSINDKSSDKLERKIKLSVVKLNNNSELLIL